MCGMFWTKTTRCRKKPTPSNCRRLNDKIELKNVSFNYQNENKSVLKDLSLIVPKGQMVALVGESGGGKSSLIKLVQRLHDPNDGAILWDGTDLRDADLRSLKKCIALVTQETVLFNDTIRYNISYGNPRRDRRGNQGSRTHRIC